LTKHWRILGSVVFAAAITFIGAEAFLWGVHDSSLWLKVVLAVCVPVAALANRINFFDSDVVYVGSIVTGFILWACIGYFISSRLRREQLPNNSLKSDAAKPRTLG
jgi:hypothetical protein